MDISALSNDEIFNEIEWINSIFKGIQKNEKESLVEDAVSKLQIMIQQANVAIESTTAQIISTVPAISNESKNLEELAKNLKEKMQILESQISKSENAFSMANLERLDDLKSKLDAAKCFLEQNDSFSKLTNDLDDLLEASGDKKEVIGLACEKLYALQKSYDAQSGLAGQNERQLVLEEFKNRLEAQITSDVVKALSENNVEESIKFVELFKKIDRLPQMKNYYATLQRESFAAKWRDYENSDNQRFLSDFYEFLVSSWSKQLKWHREVFSSDGVNETVAFIVDLLTSLHPSRETVISNHLKRVDDKMEFLAEVTEANEKFAANLLEKIEESGVEVEKGKLSAAIFDFFKVFIVMYNNLEQTWLNSQLESTKILQSNAGDTIRCLENSLVKVFEWSAMAVERSRKITQDCAIVSLIYILNTFFKSFLEKVKKAQLQLDASRSSEHQDWNLLQICINFLSLVGSFKLKVDEVEEEIRATMLAKSKAIKAGEEFRYKLVGQRDVSDFERITVRIAANESLVVFESLVAPIEAITKDTHQTILQLIFAPIENFFKRLEISDTNPDLPDYSFSPLEYITEIGQFLLTLPQNLEPLLLNPAKPLKLALEIGEQSYKDVGVASADVLLSLIADETCALYQEKVLQIIEIGDGGAKQLATDIEYLASVLEELGLTISSQLKQIAQLLKIKGENYMTASGGDARLVAAIRQIRKIQINDSV